MLWILLFGLAAVFLWSQRRHLRPPDSRSMAIAGLGVLAALAARSGKVTIALGLGLVALSLVMFWKSDRGGPATDWPHDPLPAGQPMTVRDAYAILGLAPGASTEDIKQAHRRLMKLAHPDAGGTHQRAARLNEAKDLLLARS